MQLNPREAFTIVRQIEDHTDSTTYYVRAVVRNAKTDALLATVDLVDQGNRRFSNQYLVPVDVSGQGFWISILTSVYTDSGYTTKSPNYGDKMETYLVQDRFNANLGGVGGGPDIDYKKIKKLITDAMSEMQPHEPKVVTITKEVVKEVRVPEVKIVETQTVQDLSPILKAIKQVGQKVDDKEIPEPPEFDPQPILDTLGAMKEQITEATKATFKKIDSISLDVKLSDFVPNAKVSAQPNYKVDPRISKLINLRP